MGKLIGPPISDFDKDFLEKQHIFFVASSPLSKHHKVNISPKSCSEFRVINSNTVCWLDLSGSGAETVAHIFENERLTLMFYEMIGNPRIIRLFGKGCIILPHELLDTTDPTSTSTLYYAKTGFKSEYNFTKKIY